jgi:hypothetical protein
VDSANSTNSVIPVVLTAGDSASGLAEMLHQFIEQTLEGSPRKARLGRRLAGEAVFRSAEDEDLSVGIRFRGDRIELCDGVHTDAGSPSVTADFLTIAHLTSGQESPFRLLAQRKLKVSFSAAQLPFLLGMLRFMRLESATSAASWRRWLLPATAAAAAAGAAYWYVVVAA